MINFFKKLFKPRSLESQINDLLKITIVYKIDITPFKSDVSLINSVEDCNQKILLQKELLNKLYSALSEYDYKKYKSTYEQSW